MFYLGYDTEKRQGSTFGNLVQIKEVRDQSPSEESCVDELVSIFRSEAPEQAQKWAMTCEAILNAASRQFKRRVKNNVGHFATFHSQFVWNGEIIVWQENVEGKEPNGNGSSSDNPASSKENGYDERMLRKWTRQMMKEC